MISRRQEYQYLKWDFTWRVSDSEELVGVTNRRRVGGFYSVKELPEPEE